MATLTFGHLLSRFQTTDVTGGSLPPERFFDSVSDYVSGSLKSDMVAPPPEPVPPVNIKWEGDWFVNVGEGIHRTWADCVKYGFIAAGQGSAYIKGLKKLEIGSTLYAYMAGHGYVGVGTVTRKAVPIKDFVVGSENILLLDMPLKAEKPDENKDNPALSEWVVGVRWIETVQADQAYRFIGAFANPQVVCKLKHRRTLEFLREKFKRAEDWFVNVGEKQGHLLWEDCLRYGCISAGGGQKYRDAIRKLQPDDAVYAYITGAGYVGYGKVVENAVPVKDFMVRDVPLLEQNLATVRFEESQDKNDLEISDWVVRIKWLKTYQREQARFFPGAFVHRGTLCKLSQRKTLEFLHQEFNAKESTMS